MCRNIAAGYLYLPGGHIEFAEPASEALKREMIEETAQKITVGPLLLTTENTFNDGRQDHHEVNLIFQAQLFHVEQLGNPGSDSAGELPQIESQESHIDFVWVDLAAAADLDIRPTQIKAWLACGGQTAAADPAGDPASAIAPTPSIDHAPHLTSFEIPTPPNSPTV